MKPQEYLSNAKADKMQQNVYNLCHDVHSGILQSPVSILELGGRGVTLKYIHFSLNELTK